MSLRDTICTAAQKRIRFREENGVLRFQAPPGMMDESTKVAIRKYRDSYLQLVKTFSSRWCFLAPASINQTSLVFINTLSAPTPAYHVAVSYRLCSQINREAFNLACNSLCQNHSQLRASFKPMHDIDTNSYLLYQVIKDWDVAPVHYIEEEFPDSEALQSAVKNAYAVPFDLEQGPLVRWTVFNASTSSPVVLMTLHHAITDAWSIRILFKELFVAYSNILQEVKIPVKNTIDKHNTYTDFTVQQYAMVEEKKFKEHISDFCGLLQPCITPLALAADFPRPELVELQGESLPFVLKTDTYNRIVSFAQQHTVSVNDILFTAYALLLHAETDQHSFTIGVPVANRNNSLFSDITGYFVNTLPIPVGMHTITDRIIFLQSIHILLQKTAAFQDIPFPTLVAHLNPPRAPSRSPVFQVLFNYISRSLLGAATDFIYEEVQEDIHHQIEGISVRPFPLPQQEGQYELTLEIIERNGYASGQLKYSTALFKRSTAERFLARYLQILDELLSNQSGSITKKQVLPITEQARLAVTATFTADLMSDSLVFWTRRLGLKVTPEFAPYGQLMQQLLDPDSLLRTNNNGCNVILIRLDDLRYTENAHQPLPEVLSARCDEIYSAVEAASTSVKAPFLIFFCPSAPDLTANSATKVTIDSIQSKYTTLFNELPGVYATPSDTILSWYPVEQYHDRLRLDNGHIPYTNEFYIALATAIIRRYFVITQKPVKVLSVDCDDTLWSGVAAEDGPAGITVTEDHRRFHNVLSHQGDAGRLLTLVSKNNAEDVNVIFSENRLIDLPSSAIYSKKINWKPKSENIRSLASEVNIGFDGFLFIDNNPVECAEVSESIPQVLVVTFPSTPSEIPPFLSGLWMLDNPKTTQEDLKRTQFYNTEKQRSILKEQTVSLAEFLSKLELKVIFEDLNDSNGERLSQLTYRTNQFNFSNTTYSFQELRQLQRDGYLISAVSVKDRFGDYGIVGMTALHVENNIASVPIFLLSCRVLGRGVEYHIVNKLAETAFIKNASVLGLHYTATNRNQPAMNFIESIMHQSEGSVRENGVVSIRLPQLPQFTVLTSTHEQSITTLPGQLKKDTSSTDQSSQDIANRNRCYRDIVTNLSSLGQISSAVQHSLQNKRSISPAFVDTPIGRSPFELQIAEVWKRVLQLDTVPVDTNFFDLGGKSLQLPQILADLDTLSGIKISLVDLFKFTTIRTLAEYIRSQTQPEVNKSTPIPDSVTKRLSGMQAMRQKHLKSRSNLNSTDKG
jgi:FkbH-like protein